MPRIRMLRTAAGPLGAFNEGTEYDVSGEVGTPLVSDGAAEWVGAPPVERAVRTAPEARGTADAGLVVDVPAVAEPGDVSVPVKRKR